MQDEQIIDLYWERSEEAIRETDKKYGKYCGTIAWNILYSAEDAEECVNDTWLAVWNSIPPQRPGTLGGYVCRIARNNAVSRLRANTACKRDDRYDLVLDELAEAIPSGADVETEYDAKELTEAIDRFLAAQNREERILFVRRYFFGDSPEELAARTQSSGSRVRVRLFRLREKLKKMLQKEGLLV